MPHAGHRFPEDLAAILQIAWRELELACSDRTHGFHTGALASLDKGAQPDVRICTLRRVEPHSRLIMTHADIRAPKALQVRGGAPVAWVFYDAGRRLQVRIRGVAHVEQDSPLADEQWERTNVVSRRCYLAPHAPSTPRPGLDVNMPEHLRPGRPSIAETLPGRANFCVLVTRVEALDAMELAADGHRRGAFVWTGEAGPRGEWRTP